MTSRPEGYGSVSPIREKIWYGSIPTRIILNPGESRVFDSADPFYIQLPRISYLPLYLPQILAFFTPFLINPSDATLANAWLEFDSVPLKWHLPIGLLYDHITGRDPNTEYEEHADDPGKLPWTLILHLRPEDYPSSHLLPYTGGGEKEREGAVQEVFMNSMKEADYMRNGSAKAVMSLSKEDSTTLWDSLVDLECKRFWSVADKLVRSSKDPLRHVPIKLYIPTSDRVIQKLVMPLTSARKPKTLGTVLKEMVPALFPSTRVETIAKPVLHGIVLRLNIPLLELMYDAIYPDGFLHIALIMMS
ncbi:APG5-domain-containing protein [Ascobolus immersus RN42]|uniref:Autophagy protein 5 n=1 Tax=Ascobolus immersus RN42 TaxID=1160509 RepID=A0A3N4ICZ0_ASCIM|nr:APG5-domain-containing protein [Ascobolus immersus RN42]